MLWFYNLTNWGDIYGDVYCSRGFVLEDKMDSFMNISQSWEDEIWNGFSVRSLYWQWHCRPARLSEYHLNELARRAMSWVCWDRRIRWQVGLCMALNCHHCSLYIFCGWSVLRWAWWFDLLSVCMDELNAKGLKISVVEVLECYPWVATCDLWRLAWVMTSIQSCGCSSLDFDIG